MQAPRLPRAEWPRHPRFPAQALLLESHEAFRRGLEAFARRVDFLSDDTSEPSRKRRRWIARMHGDFTFWLTGMSGHERYEERRLYPQLADRFRVSFDDLERQHRALATHKARVCDALASADGPRVPLGAIRAAFLAFEAALADHLEREENLVIPMLLELRPEEFRAVAPSSLGRAAGS